jgi:hypothetical protein
MKPLRLLGALVLLCVATLAQTNPVPMIYQPLLPVTVKPGNGAFMLTINGTGFVNPVVTWNGSTRTTYVISNSQVQAQISAADVANPGTAFINVVNPAPGGGISNTLLFPIQTPSPSVVVFPAPGFSGSGVSVAGDFNNDGFADLAVADNTNTGNGFFINSYLGKGDGTFNPPFPNHSITPVAFMATGTFNKDSLVDLAVFDALDNTTIFLNHGSGVFIQRQVFHSPPFGLATGDFNGDGKLDLVVPGYMLEIFLGNGDGTFSQGTFTYGEAYSFFFTPAVGDFNGDGKLDLVVPDSGGNMLVFLGNGDGTFQQPVFYGSCNGGNSATTADINGDGKLDVLTNQGSILLGNGDGTFSCGREAKFGGPGVTFSPPLLGDFNGDGKLDVALETLNHAIYLSLGNGDGTFQPAIQLASDNATTLAIADFNSDGKLDLVGTSLYLQSPIIFSPASLDFGTQNVGTKSQPRNVTALNDGGSALPITSINIGGSDPNDFSQTNKCPSSLPIGATCPIAVVFQPQAGGSRSATLNVNYQGLGSPQTVPLSGVGAISTVTLTPAKLAFPIQLVGTTSSAQTATLTNTGTVAVNISNISTSGPFTESNNCPSSLPIGQSCQIQVKFEPVQKGLVTGNLSVTDDAAGSPQTVALSGMGTAVKLSAPKINFGNQQVGTKSSPAPVQVTNVGPTTISIYGISIKGLNPGDFSQTNNCKKSLRAGDSCTIQITFAPQVKGKRSASLHVSDNGGGSPQTVGLLGNGT